MKSHRVAHSFGPAGTVFVLAAGGMTLAGLLAASGGLILAGGILGGFVLSALLVAEVNLRGLRFERRLPYPVFAGESFRGCVMVTNAKRLFPSALLFLQDEATPSDEPRRPTLFTGSVHVLAPGEARPAAYRGLFFRHGERALQSVRITSVFPLGIFRSRIRIPLPETTVVYPRLRDIPRSKLPPDRGPEHADVNASRVDDLGHDFAGLREYRPGDNPRWIYWKSLGRPDDRLLIREWESVTNRRAAVLLDVRIPEDLPRPARSVERAVSWAASFIEALAEREYSVRVTIRSATETSATLPHDDRSRLSLFHTLALLKPTVSANISHDSDDPPETDDRYPLLTVRPDFFVGGGAPLERMVWR